MISSEAVRFGCAKALSWCGNGRARSITVLVLEDGFEWQRKRWPSLSKIAREITGTRWSGPRFFGIDKGKASGSTPAASLLANAGETIDA